MELEAFYELSRPMSEYAFSLSQRGGRSLEDCFRYLDSLRDYILPFPAQEDPDDEALTTQPKLLQECADDPFVQEMFFRLGIRLETIQYFHAYHDASQEELLDYWRNSESASLEDAYEEYEDDPDYTEDEIRLMRIKFMADYGH